MAEIGSPEALADWLEGKPPELVVALASRIALRVLPLAITGNKQEPITLAAFVVCAIAGFSHKKPGLKFSNLAASRVLAHQPTAFSDADYFAFSFAWRVFVDLARLDEANENAKTRAILHSIFGSAGTAAGLAASFDNLYTIGASRFHEERIKREKADGTFPARKSGLIDATAVQMMADSVKQDCDYWERGGIALSNILARPLWPEGAPDFFLREYNRALDLWRTEPENWSNWIEWYERKLRGSRSDWGLPFKQDEELSQRFLQADSDFWSRVDGTPSISNSAIGGWKWELVEQAYSEQGQLIAELQKRLDTGSKREAQTECSEQEIAEVRSECEELGRSVRAALSDFGTEAPGMMGHNNPPETLLSEIESDSELSGKAIVALEGIEAATESISAELVGTTPDVQVVIKNAGIIHRTIGQLRDLSPKGSEEFEKELGKNAARVILIGVSAVFMLALTFIEKLLNLSIISHLIQ